MQLPQNEVWRGIRRLEQFEDIWHPRFSSKSWPTCTAKDKHGVRESSAKVIFFLAKMAFSRWKNLEQPSYNNMLLQVPGLPDTTSSSWPRCRRSATPFEGTGCHWCYTSTWGACFFCFFIFGRLDGKTKNEEYAVWLEFQYEIMNHYDMLNVFWGCKLCENNASFTVLLFVRLGFDHLLAIGWHGLSWEKSIRCV